MKDEQLHAKVYLKTLCLLCSLVTTLITVCTNTLQYKSLSELVRELDILLNSNTNFSRGEANLSDATDTTYEFTNVELLKSELQSYSSKFINKTLKFAIFDSSTMHVELQATRSPLTMHNVREFKLVVVGPRRVGKSALVVRFLTKRFISEYVENTDMSCKGVADVDEESLRINIQDTSEKGMRLSTLEQSFRCADAMMFVYSITDSESFRRLKDIGTKLLERNNDSEEKEFRRMPPMVLVGNKGDLENVRNVTLQQGFELSEKLHCDFFETSAREGWSKLVSRISTSSSTCSPTSDTDTINLFAGATASVGLAGFPCSSAPKWTHNGNAPLHIIAKNPNYLCKSPGLTIRVKDNDDDLSSPSSLFVQHRASVSSAKSKGHKRSNSFVGRSEVNAVDIPLVNITAAPQSNSPTINREKIDEKKYLTLLLPSSGRKATRNGSIIGRLSPRLSRRLNKGNNAEGREVKVRDDNNNKSKTLNHIAVGLTSTLIASARLNETICKTGTSQGIVNSSESNINNSNTGSKESLTFCEQELGGKLQQRDFGGSEPFLQLCREGISHKGRIRARSPSHLIAHSLKRIRSFKNDQGRNHNNNNNKQSSNTLAVPVVRL